MTNSDLDFDPNKGKTLKELADETSDQKSNTTSDVTHPASAEHASTQPYSTIKSNNWLNIRHSKVQTWLGQVGHKDGFVLFDKPEYSVRAFMIIMRNYMNRQLDTVSKIANTYAPPEDGNHPEVYVKLAITKDPTLATRKVTTYDIPLLASVFLKVESGIDKDVAYFTNIKTKYNLA